MRRKGEAKLKRHWPDWGPEHPVHNAIRRGSGWFSAWYSQACTTWPQIEKQTGIAADRLAELDHGALPSSEELQALAEFWRCPVEQIKGSLPQLANRALECKHPDVI